MLRCYNNNIEGTRQIDSVTFGEGVLVLKRNRIGSDDCLIKT